MSLLLSTALGHFGQERVLLEQHRLHPCQTARCIWGGLPLARSGGCELGGWLKTSLCISAHKESKAVRCGHSRRGDTQQHVPAVCLAKRGVLQCSSARVCSIRVGQMKGASQHPYLRAATGCLRENTRDGGRTGQSFPSTLTSACRAGALGTRAPGGEQVRQEQGG